MSENNTNQTQTQAEAQAQTQTEPEITLTLTPDELQEDNKKQLAELTQLNQLNLLKQKRRQLIHSQRRLILWIPIQFFSMVLQHRRK